jgi:hypothetical protein
MKTIAFKPVKPANPDDWIKGGQAARPRSDAD